MLTIFKIPTKLDLKWGMYLSMVGTTISLRPIKQIIKTCGLSSIRGNTTKLIMLHALHKLKNDTLRGIKLNIYRRSLSLSLTLE